MLKENLSFVGICVLVFAALLGLAYLFERTVCRDLQRRSRSRNRHININNPTSSQLMPPMMVISNANVSISCHLYQMIFRIQY